MQLDFDTLRSVKALAARGVPPLNAEAIIEVLASTQWRNLYSKEEINIMIPETSQKIIDEYMAKIDRDFAARRAEEQKRLAVMQKESEMRIRKSEEELLKLNKELEADRFDRRESQRNFRMVVATIISTGLGLAGYLSALLHFTKFAQ